MKVSYFAILFLVSFSFFSCIQEENLVQKEVSSDISRLNALISAPEFHKYRILVNEYIDYMSNQLDKPAELGVNSDESEEKFNTIKHQQNLLKQSYPNFDALLIKFSNELHRIDPSKHFIAGSLQTTFDCDPVIRNKINGCRYGCYVFSDLCISRAENSQAVAACISDLMNCITHCVTIGGAGCIE